MGPALAVLLVASVIAQATGLVVPKNAATEFENDRVRILRVHYQPHEKGAMVENSAKVVIALTPGRIRLTRPDGTATEWQLKIGTVTWTDRERHAVENLSDQPVDAIEVEIKQARTPAAPVTARQSTPAKEPMPAAQEPHHYWR